MISLGDIANATVTAITHKRGRAVRFEFEMEIDGVPFNISHPSSMPLISETSMRRMFLEKAKAGEMISLYYAGDASWSTLSPAWRRRKERWDEALERKGSEDRWNLTVLSVRNRWASVVTEEGFLGRINWRDFGSMKWTDLKEGTMLQNWAVSRGESWRMPSTKRVMPIFFEPDWNPWIDVEEGDVVEAKILSLGKGSILIGVAGRPAEIPKGDISGYARPWSPADVFKINEDIKVYCMSSGDEVDMVWWSMRALERVPGIIVLHKDMVFAEAEETGKLFYQRQQEEKEEKMKMMKRMEEAECLRIQQINELCEKYNFGVWLQAAFVFFNSPVEINK